MKKYKWFFLIFGMVFLGLLFKWIWQSRAITGKDLKLGLLLDDGVGLVSISWDRRMVNSLKVAPEVHVWIPGGLGWYQADRVARVLKQEGQPEDEKNIFFYNFGFNPDVVLRLSDFDDWDKDLLLISKIGWWDYFRFKNALSTMIFKDEELETEISEASWLERIWARDFADSGLLSDDVRVTVINTTDESGLANFVASRLEWSGVTVVGLLNDEVVVENCEIRLGSGVEDSLVLNLISNYFDCQVKDGLYLADGEIELYLGESFSQMIKYLSYVRSF